MLCTEPGAGEASVALADKASGHHAVPCSAWANPPTLLVGRGVRSSPGIESDGSSEGSSSPWLQKSGMALQGPTKALAGGRTSTAKSKQPPPKLSQRKKTGAEKRPAAVDCTANSKELKGSGGQ